jgi:hypothetical protein
LSPQNWNHLFVSKHHYAIELAKMGNRVYFVNPPSAFPNFTIKLKQAPGYDNITLVEFGYLLPFHLFLKYQLTEIFRIQLNWIIKNIKKKTDSIDEIWNFNPTIFFNSSSFNAKKEIVFIYDYYDLSANNFNEIKVDLFVSISTFLLKPFSAYNVPKLKLNHALSAPFITLATNRLNSITHDSRPKLQEKLNVGFSGNMFHSHFDYKTFYYIIKKNYFVNFHLWGEHNTDSRDNCSTEIKNFIKYLHSVPNVFLHGKIHPNDLAIEYSKMDLFLCCYDISTAINGGNSHKIMEYLSSGNLIVSNYLYEFRSFGDLILMPESTDNTYLPHLFNKAIANLNYYNSSDKVIKRCRHALQNTYGKNIKEIEAVLNDSK